MLIVLFLGILLFAFLYVRWSDMVDCEFCRVHLLREHTKTLDGKLQCLVCAEQLDDYPRWRTTNRPTYERCADCKRDLPKPALRGFQEDPEDVDSVVMLCRRNCLPRRQHGARR